MQHFCRSSNLFETACVPCMLLSVYEVLSLDQLPLHHPFAEPAPVGAKIKCAGLAPTNFLNTIIYELISTTYYSLYILLRL